MNEPTNEQEIKSFIANEINGISIKELEDSIEQKNLLEIRALLKTKKAQVMEILKQFNKLNDNPAFVNICEHNPNSYVAVALLRANFMMIEYRNHCSVLIDKYNNMSVLPINIRAYKLEWNNNFSQNDFLELCKALIETKAIIGKQEDFLDGFSALLKIKMENPDQQIQSLKTGRSIAPQTKFIDTLKTSYKDWLEKQENG
jgi:hypothetical protein